MNEIKNIHYIKIIESLQSQNDEYGEKQPYQRYYIELIT